MGKPPIPQPRYTAAEMCEALLATAGIKTATAERLRCHVDTVNNYIARYPTVAAAYEQARSRIVDMSESILIQRLNAKDWDAAKFVLTTLGKDRGWGHTLDVRFKLADIARQIAEETGEPFDEVLVEVTDLASERRKRRVA